MGLLQNNILKKEGFKALGVQLTFDNTYGRELE